MNTSHFVLGNSMVEPWPESMQTAVFGLGCFWGAERKFWQLDGVYTSAVGYSGGTKLNPTYREVCNGDTMHAEVVLVVLTWRKFLMRSCCRSFGSHTTQHKACVKATTSAPNIAARFISRTLVSKLPHSPPGIFFSNVSHKHASARSQPRSNNQQSFIMPRSITSSISPRIRAVIAASVARASHAQLA